MITFRPLSGAARSSISSPLAYLLQVDDVVILLDCGSPDWSPEKDEKYWEGYCTALKECAPSVDLVLISHGDLPHAGLYPFAYSRWGLKAPAYTTLPVQALARIAVTEDVEGLRDEQEFPTDSVPDENEPVPEVPAHAVGTYIATLQEVQDSFNSVNTLRYSQPTHLQGKCQGITITPFNAGHTLGGTIWKIRSPTSGTIMYAVNMNHMRERHLDGTALIRQAGAGVYEPLARPDLFITDADRASVTTSRRKDRDAALIDTITSTLSSRSSVLMPCDSSSRVLELLVLLDQHWSYSRLHYPICFLSRTGSEMLTFVRSMMEWLGGTVSKEDIGEDGNNTGGRYQQQQRKRKRDQDDGDEDALGAFALRFKHLEFFPTPQSLMQSYSSKEPKLILAVPSSLSHGPSRRLFCDFAAVPDNVVLLTTRSEHGTLGRDLFNHWNDAQRAEVKWDKGKVGSNVMMDGAIKLTINSKVPLHGAELELYLEKEKAANEKEAAQQAVLVRNQRMLEADDEDSDSDSDSDSEEEDEQMQTDPGEKSNPDSKRRKRDKDAGIGTDWEAADDGLTKQLLSFDIYLKGNVSKATSFFKTASGQAQQRFRMFPFVEKKRRVDEYGETLDVGMWLRKGKVLEEDAETDEVRELKRKALLEEEAKAATHEPPSKFVSSVVEVQMACRLLFVDMDGLNDGRAVKTIVPQVNPRKMIIVHAPDQATDALIESCSNIRAMTKDIFAPIQGESIQIGQQTNSFSVSISDELLASLKMSRFEDNEVGFVTGRIVTHAGSTVPTLEPLLVSTESSESTRAPTSSHILGCRAPQTLPHSTMIGELKLTALKARLASVGVQAELIGEGVLVCGAGARKAVANASDKLDDSVSVKKTGKGKVELEGNVSEVYYLVRREIYNLHALVAA